MAATALQKQRKNVRTSKLSILPLNQEKRWIVYSLADLALIRAFCAKPSIYA